MRGRYGAVTPRTAGRDAPAEASPMSLLVWSYQ